MPQIHPTGVDIKGSEMPSSNPYGLAGDRSNVEASEMCWGLGLTPKGKENADPRSGGRYQGIPSEAPQRIVPMSRDSRI